MSYTAVIDFWFNTLTPKDWWVKNTQLDDLIKQKFLDTHTAAAKGELYTWRENALGRLAEIIVLDQFSRNMFRDTAASFAYDSLALILAQEATAVKADQTLNPTQRSFMYMPFMHSESLLIHDIAVDLFTKNGVTTSIDFEEKHRQIIQKYGRYPHRNAILGRQSTPEEVVFLTQPNSSF